MCEFRARLYHMTNKHICFLMAGNNKQLIEVLFCESFHMILRKKTVKYKKNR
jgi:hypothetical protein